MLLRHKLQPQAPSPPIRHSPTPTLLLFLFLVTTTDQDILHLSDLALLPMNHAFRTIWKKRGTPKGNPIYIKFLRAGDCGPASTRG